MSKNLPKGVVQRQVEILIVEANGKNSVHKVQGWVYGRLAVTKEWDRDTVRKNWVITHLPTGSDFSLWGGQFLTRELAIKAMLEIYPLHPNWKGLDTKDYSPLKGKIIEICTKHTGSQAPRRFRSDVTSPMNELH